MALLSGDFLRELHFAVVESHADTAQDVLYRTGYEWALRSMVSFTTRKSSVAGPLPTDTAGWISAWWSGLENAGWGGVRVLPTSGAETALLELTAGAVADVLGKADDPVCHLYAGLFAGAYSFLERAERHAVEISCRAVGHGRCLFVIGPAAAIDRVETWRQHGTTSEEIVSRIAATEAGVRTGSDAAPKTRAAFRQDGLGRPVAGGTAEMLRGLQFVLETERTGSWTTVLKAVGRVCGRKLAVEHDAELSRTGRPALATLPLSSALLPLEGSFRDFGWGILTIDTSSAEDFGLVVASLAGSAFAELLDDSASFADPLPAGMIQGFLEHITGQALACDEIECAHGRGPCTFALSTPERLAMIAPFVGHESGERIIARLRS